MNATSVFFRDFFSSFDLRSFASDQYIFYLSAQKLKYGTEMTPSTFCGSTQPLSLHKVITNRIIVTTGEPFHEETSKMKQEKFRILYDILSLYSVIIIGNCSNL